MSLLARPLRAAVCTVLVLSGCVTAGPAVADEPGCAHGRSLRYVVAFDRGTAESSARGQITGACGATTVYYPQIAVAIATSGDPGFGERIGLDRAFSAQAERLAAQRATDPVKPQPARAALPRTDPAKVPTADLSDRQWDMRMINAGRARGFSDGSRDVVVGVLDSGVDPDHPDLADALDPADSAGCLTGAPDRSPAAWAPTTSVHGTHVAGIIAAADDGRGVTGVAPGVRVASVKVIDDRGYADPEAAVCGLMWAASRHMRLTNSSFFVNPWTLSCIRGNDRGVVHEALARAVEYSTSAGTLNVAAATNEAVDLTPSARSGSPGAGSGCEALPAGLRDVVAVSAVGSDRVKAGYSSYGLGVIDVTAPGGETGECVLSTVPGGYAPLCGTSMAAPHVTGVLALLASRDPGARPRQLRRTLDAQATPMACPADYDLTGDGTQDAYCAGYEGFNGFYGHGMVDALAAAAPRGRPDPAR
ncbi:MULTISPECIES: S8 family serine peptidase [unclassified Amycolatopsis]|uniref:S8 family peptidase n=1 Tax=unclassified Amycolatopsis TaxID=2618356 RepID=UPI001FF2F645|nr:S8 family serine peptidase [Amycolatopsis sp. FBCC-B4732]UOX89700.1 S8 family serine peptidase [Amycolatopsis sp. FBCC-B4732]